MIRPLDPMADARGVVEIIDEVFPSGVTTVESWAQQQASIPPRAQLKGFVATVDGAVVARAEACLELVHRGRIRLCRRQRPPSVQGPRHRQRLVAACPAAPRRARAEPRAQHVRRDAGSCRIRTSQRLQRGTRGNAVVRRPAHGRRRDAILDASARTSARPGPGGCLRNRHGHDRRRADDRCRHQSAFRRVAAIDLAPADVDSRRQLRGDRGRSASHV